MRQIRSQRRELGDERTPDPPDRRARDCENGNQDDGDGRPSRQACRTRQRRREGMQDGRGQHGPEDKNQDVSQVPSGDQQND